MYFSFQCNNTNRAAARGVLIAIHTTCDFKKDKIIRGNGMFIILLGVLNGIKCALGNIYLPPNSYAQCLHSVYSHLQSVEGRYRLLLAGDFNTVLEDIDTNSKTSTTQTLQFKEFCNNLNLVDVWRAQHPGILEFTCVTHTSCGTVVVSRLDLFLISQNLMNIIGDCNILGNGGSDHDAIGIAVLSDIEMKTLFRFPQSLLKDTCFRNLLSFNIDRLVQENEGASARTLWEIIKCCIRSTASKYTYDRKKSCQDRIKEVNDRMTALKKAIFEGQYNMQIQMTARRELEVLTSLRDKLFEEEDRARLRTNWKDSYGNRGTSTKKFFRNIRDKMSYVQVCQLRDHMGTVQSSREDVLEIARDFYDDLYRHRPVLTPDSPADLFLPRISREESNFIDSPFQFNEFGEALKELRKGRAPGNDGLTVEFYLAFWDLIGYYVFDAIREAVEHGELGPSLRQGVVKLIPKKDRDLLHITNWRGICLLNVDYKIFSKVIANRIRLVLSKIIHPDQKAFIPGRHMSNAMYDLYATQKVVDEEELDVLLESLDIHKAFDSISWQFLEYSYSQFGFSSRFVDLLRCLYKNREVYICNNGFLSNKIKVGRGCPQGDCLSPVNFIVAIELLASRVRYNNNISPIRIFDVSKKLNLVADDVLLMYHNTHVGCREVSRELTTFYHHSGLYVNDQKCAIMRIGRSKHTPLSDNRRRGIPRCQKGFKYIGITYMMDHSEMARVTFTDKFDQIKLALSKRSKIIKKEPLVSRVYALSSLYFSKLRYFINLLPMIPANLCKKFQREFQDAVWNNSRHQVNMETSSLPVRCGGLGGMDVMLTSTAYKVHAVKYIFHHDDEAPQFWQLQLASAIKFDINDIVRANVKWVTVRKHCNSLPLYWQDCIQAWCKFHYGQYESQRFDIQEMFARPVFLNSMLGTGQNTYSCNLYIHRNCLEHYQLYTVYDLVRTDVDTIPQRRNQISCVRKNTVNLMLKHVPHRFRNVQRPLIHETVAKKICDQKISLKDIVNMLQQDTRRKICKRWKTDYIVMTEDKWIKLCQNIPLFVNKSIKTYFLLSNLRAYWYRADAAKNMPRLSISNVCRLCKQKSETWIHVYIECHITKGLWARLENALPFKYRSLINQESIFAPCDIPIELVIIIVLTKYFVHLCACISDKYPHYTHLVNHIKYHCKASIVYAIEEKRGFKKYWQNVLKMFDSSDEIRV